MSDEPTPRPWGNTGYQLATLADELDIDFRQRWFEHRVKSCRFEVVEIDGDHATLRTDRLLPENINAFHDLIRVVNIHHAEGGIRIEVTLDG